MNLSFVVFLFVGTIWDQNAGLGTPDIQFELTRAACEMDRAQWLLDHETANASQAPAFRQGYGATPCFMVISQAQAKQS